MISIFVPAYNEQKNLPKTFEAILKIAGELSLEIEILAVDDGSQDETATIIRDYSHRYPFVRGIFHSRNEGIGASFREALDLAKYDRITLVPGDNLVAHSTLYDLLKQYRAADVVLAYTVNVEYRSRMRRCFSAIYTWLCKVTFRLPVRYIHATPVYPVAYLRELDLRCTRYSFPSESTIKCLRSGCSYLEIPGYMNPDVRRSSAVRLKNAWEAIRGYLNLVYEIYLQSRSRYGLVPTPQTDGTSF